MTRLCLGERVSFRNVSLWLDELGFPAPRVRARSFPARPEPSKATWKSGGTSIVFEYIPSPDRRYLTISGDARDTIAQSAVHRLDTIEAYELEQTILEGEPDGAFVAAFRLAGLLGDRATPVLLKACAADLEPHVHNGCVRALGILRGTPELATRLEALAADDGGLALETRALARDVARTIRERLGKW